MIRDPDLQVLAMSQHEHQTLRSQVLAVSWHEHQSLRSQVLAVSRHKHQSLRSQVQPNKTEMLGLSEFQYRQVQKSYRISQ